MKTTHPIAANSVKDIEKIEAYKKKKLCWKIAHTYVHNQYACQT